MIQYPRGGVIPSLRRGFKDDPPSLCSHVRGAATSISPGRSPFPLFSFNTRPAITTPSTRRVVVEDSIAPASIISEWFERTHETLPEGAVAIQASCSHSSPLPALLYGRGAWPAVDLLFFSSDIPSTSMGETEGSSYRIDVVNVFRTDQEPLTPESKHNHQIGGARRTVTAARSLLNLGGDGATGGGAVSPHQEHALTARASHSPPIQSSSKMFSRARSLARFEPLTALKGLEEEHVSHYLSCICPWWCGSMMTSPRDDARLLWRPSVSSSLSAHIPHIFSLSLSAHIPTFSHHLWLLTSPYFSSSLPAHIPTIFHLLPPPAVSEGWS